MTERASSDGQTLGMTPFIWSSGPEHAENVIAGNESLVSRLRAMPRLKSSSVVPIAKQRMLPPANPPSNGLPRDGEELAKGYRPHVVVKGETLWGLAKKRWPEIKVVVPLKDARQLEVGSVLMIPEDIPG